MVKLKKLKFEKKGLESFLSPLESQVLNILLTKKTMKVREIYDVLKKRRKVALTSVAVILDRLHDKGMVDREVESGRGGFHYIYSPMKNKSQFEQSIVENTVNKLIDTFGKSAVNYFNERFSKKRR